MFDQATVRGLMHRDRRHVGFVTIVLLLVGLYSLAFAGSAYAKGVSKEHSSGSQGEFRRREGGAEQGGPPQISQISGWVLEDLNGNGVWENSEPGIGGVRVNLHEGVCSVELAAPLASDVTPASGKYSFRTPPGSYCLTVDPSTLPSNMVPTGAKLRIQVSLPASALVTDQDFLFASAYVNNRLTVALTTCDDIAWLQRLAGQYDGIVTDGNNAACFFVVETPPAQQVALRNALLNEPTVASADQDVRVRGNYTPNDPFYNSVNHVYGPQQINAPQAWDITTGSADVIVAVVDSGVDLTHEEFAGRILPGYDYVNSDNDPSDDNGHGTHVAGILAAGVNNGLGIAGIAGNVKLLPMKALDDRNLGYWSHIGLAIMDAVDRGAQIINLSLGGTVDSSMLRNAVRYAVERNALVVVAAGNNASDTLYFPASYDNVLAVGATDANGNRWSLSNFGPNVDLMAPGSTVYSAYWQSGQSNSYQFMSGTSMATPHVAGVAALLRSVNPLIQREQMVEYLTSTAVDMGAAGFDSLHGYGRVDAGAAVRAAFADLPAIRLTKSADKTDASVGDRIAYSITLEHLGGQGLLTNMVVTDVIPTGMTYVSGSVGAGGVYENETVRWDFGSMAEAIPASNGHGGGSSAVITLTAVADTYIQAYSTARNTNSGAGAFMQTHVCCTATELQAVSLVRFDLSAIPPGATVTRADLQLWETLGTTGRTDRVYRMLTNWSEGNGTAGSGATWNTRNGSASWAGGAFSTVDYDAANPLGTINGSGAASRKVVSVLPAVNAWINGGAPNNGFALVASAGAQNQYLRYRTREWGTTGDRPQLVIEYSTAAINTATFAPSGGVDTSDGNFTLAHVLLDDGVYDFFATGNAQTGQTWNWSNIVPNGVSIYSVTLSVNLIEQGLSCGAGNGGFQILSGGAVVGVIDASALAPSPCLTDSQELTWNLNLLGAGLDTAAEVNALSVRIWWDQANAASGNGVDAVSLQVVYAQEGPDVSTNVAIDSVLVRPGDLFTVTMHLSATETVAGVIPAGLAVGSDGIAVELVSGPTPPLVSVSPTGTPVRWVYRAGQGAAAGRIIAGGYAESGAIRWPLGQSNSVIVAPPLTFTAEVAPDPQISFVHNVAYFKESTGYIPTSQSNQVAVGISERIGGLVWADLNGDGLQTGLESGLANVTIRYTRLGGGTSSVETDANGRFVFNGLSSGIFTLTVDLMTVPSGYGIFTTAYPRVVHLAHGQAFLAADFGLKSATTAIGDFIWYDADGDGLQELGEPGIGNVRMNLYEDSDRDGRLDPSRDRIVDTSVSDANGGYRLNVAADGVYFVEAVALSPELNGMTPTLGPQSVATSQPISIAIGEILRQVDFGFLRRPAAGNGVIRDLVWLDGNRDGLRTPDEPALPGVTVCAAPVGGGVALCADSDRNGRLLIEAPAGAYVVSSSAVLFGLEATTAPAHSVTLAVGEQHAGAHFGFAHIDDQSSASVGGLVWLDLPTMGQVDGMFDPTRESGLPDMSINLIHDLNQNGALDAGEPVVATLTDYEGTYRFGALLAGRYLVDIPDTLLVSPTLGKTVPGPDPHAGYNNHPNPYPLHLTPGQIETTIDFGFRSYMAVGFAAPTDAGVIGDQLWFDANSDSRFDLMDGDAPLPGVTVELSQNGSRLATAVTGPDGKYLFTALPMGAYTVQVTDLFGVLEGYTPAPVGPNPGQDNNSQTQPFAVTLGLNSSNLTADFAYQVVAPNRARGDCNADSLIDAGDLSAVVLEVFDGDGVDPANAPGGTFPGDPIGCNVNADAVIDAGDQSCLVLAVFGGGHSCAAGGASGQAAPTLTLPQQLPATPGASVSVPITFDNGGNSISSIFFSIDFDESLLSFDPVDSDLDGIPDAIVFNVPAAFFPGVTFDASDTDGELDFTITDPIPPLAAMPNRVVATITFNVGNPPVTTNATVKFSTAPSPSFGNTSGQSVAGGGVDGSVRIVVNNNAALGDRVWWDMNGNGRQDSGEPGIPAVDVTLSGAGSGLSTTNATGNYSFTNLAAGVYTLTIPAAEFSAGGTLHNWTSSPANVGSDDGDSDGDPLTRSATVSLSPGQALNGVDFGFFMDASYTVQKTLLTPSPARPGNIVQFRFVIRNTGAGWLSTISLRETYPLPYLRFSAATPPADDNLDDGQLDWNDLTTSFMTDLAPGAAFTVTVSYLALADTGAAPGSAAPTTVLAHSVTADPDGPTGPLSALLALGNQSATGQVQIFSPTANSVQGYAYRSFDGSMTVVWQSVSEVDLLAYELYRVVGLSEPVRVWLTPMLALHSGSPSGAEYVARDVGASIDGAVTYALELIFLDGRRQWIALHASDVIHYLFLPVATLE